MNFLSSNSDLMMEKAMNFLWTKQAAILDNIANAETPNYRAKVVTFEESLKEKLEAAQDAAKPKQSVRGVLENADYFVEEQLEVTFEEDEDYDTLGGYLIGQLGRIPEDDEVIEIALHGWLFQVEAFEEKRILKVLASKLPEEEQAEEEAVEDKKDD